MTLPRISALVFLVVALLFASAQLTRVPVARISGSLLYDGHRYRTLLSPPAGDSFEAPLVIALHGYGGSIQDLAETSQLTRLNDDGYGVLFVQGLDDSGGQTVWNANLTDAPRDDLSALLVIIRQVQEIYGYDQFRTFLVGESNGGFMAYSLACRTEGVVAGIVSVNGTQSGYDWNTCVAPDPVPLLHISGKLDDVVPPDGSMSVEGGWGGAPDADTVVTSWAGRFGVVERRAETVADGAHRTQFITDNGRTAAIWMDFDRLSHEWPSPMYVGIDILSVIREFLQTVEADRTPPR